MTRADVVNTAREFLKTKFVHLGRQQSQGVDCVGLVLLVGERLNLVDRNGKRFLGGDYPTYPVMPEPGRVLVECDARLIRKSLRELKPGDVVCIKFPFEASHTAIITGMPDGNLGLIHAYNGGKFEVVEHILDAAWKRRIVAAFVIPGVEEE
jgi:cell wall-associated NlpC family hydrolase